jgi:hypothetical protein
MAQSVNAAIINDRLFAAEIQKVALWVQGLLERSLHTQQESSPAFKGLFTSPEEMEELLQNLRDLPVDQSQNSQEQTPPSPAALAQMAGQLEAQADQAGIRLGLKQIREYFNLSEFEYSAFLICLLPALDLRYQRVYGFLQDDVTRKMASVDLILSILDPARAAQAVNLTHLKQLHFFSANGSLVKYHLIRPVNNATAWLEPRLDQLFEVSPAVVDWLSGHYFAQEPWLCYTPVDQLYGVTARSADPAGLPLNWKMITDQMPLLAFDGMDAEQRDQAARIVAEHYQLPLLKVDLNRVCPDQQPLDLSTLRLMIRDTCLLEALLFLDHWDRVLDEDGFVPEAISAELADFFSLVVLGSQSPWRIHARDRRAVLQYHFEVPSGAERAAIWKQALGKTQPLSKDTLQALSSQFSLTGGQIRNAAFVVQNQAQMSGEPYTDQDLFIAARQQSNHHLGQLAQKIEPRYSWRDIVLPPKELEPLHDIVSMMRFRSVVLEEWGLGKKLAANHGLSALFTGEPGTGKTLAAQVIAAELQLDLYRIDLSNVVSKYIGETEKNLEKIFTEAHNSNAILFFDEADALFGKRSEVKDAHDRYANIEVGYLLQRMEVHDGITILATNLSGNMDDAFTRRLNYIVHFPNPDEAQRLSIWKVLLPEKMPIDAQIDWQYLAAAYPIAGGNIRNVLVAAAYLAAQDGGVVRMDHILQAVRREMQKMGRLIREEDYHYTPLRQRGVHV